MIWFGLVILLIPGKSFNVKSSLCIYINYIWLGLVYFMVISTLVGYLIPNHFYTYILNIYINPCVLFKAKSSLFTQECCEQY